MRKILAFTVDAFGTVIEPGDKVIYYTGDEATFKTGIVDHIFTSISSAEPRVIISTTKYKYDVELHKYVMSPHLANIGHRLCIVHLGT